MNFASTTVLKDKIMKISSEIYLSPSRNKTPF